MSKPLTRDEIRKRANKDADESFKAIRPMLKHARKKLLQRTKKLLAKHGNETWKG